MSDEFDPELQPREDVIAAWRADGYTEDLEVAEGGRITLTASDRTFEPEDLGIDRLHRYEGVTNPGDEEMLLAVSTPDGELKGTLTLAYGPTATADEGEVARRLPDRRER